MEESNKLMQDYIAAAVRHGEATLSGDHRLANHQYAKLQKYYQELEKDRELAESFFRRLFSHPNASVLIWAAAHSLGLHLQIEDALGVLRAVASKESSGILAFDAKMTLEQWKKNGHLKF